MTPPDQVRSEVRLVAIGDAGKVALLTAASILTRSHPNVGAVIRSIYDSVDAGITEEEAKTLTRNSIDRGVPPDHRMLQKLWFAFLPEDSP